MMYRSGQAKAALITGQANRVPRTVDNFRATEANLIGR